MAVRQRARPAQPRAVAMRRALLDATLHLLSTSGPAAVTTTAIAARAHVSTGTVYRYFNDRSEILAELRDEAVAAISGDLHVGVVTALGLELDDAMREIVVTLVSAFERHAAIVGAMVDAAPGGPNANLLPEIEADLHQLASLLPRRHRPDLDATQQEAVVFMLMGVLVSTCLRVALQRPDGVDRELLVDMTTAMVASALGSPV